MILRELITKLGFQVDDKKLKGLDKSIQSLKANIDKIGAASAAALAAVIIPASQLQRILKDAVIASGATGEAFTQMEETLRQKALSLSDELGFSANQIASGFFDVISTGTAVGTEGFEILSRTGFKFAKAAGLQTGEAIDKLSMASKTFFNDVTGATQVADAFFKANTLGQTTVRDLTEAIRDAGPAAKASNVSLADTTALLTGLADAGFKATLGGTAFRQIVQRLTTPVEKGAEVMKKLGVETTNADGSFRNIFDILVDLQKAQRGLTEEQAAANLKAIAGEEAFTRLGAILNRDLDLIKSWSKQIENSSGVMDEAFNEIMKSASEQFNLLIQNVKNLAATLGAPLLKPAGLLISSFGKLVTLLRDLIERFKFISYPIITVIGSFLALLSVLGAIVVAGKAFSFIFGTALAGKILMIAGKLGILTAVFSVFLIKIALFVLAIAVVEDLVSSLMGKEGFFSKMFDWLKKFSKESKFLQSLSGFFRPNAGFSESDYVKGGQFGFGGDLGKAMNFIEGRGVAPEAMAQQNAVSQNNQVSVQVNVPEGSNPEQTAEAVRQGTLGAMNDMLRQTNQQFTPLLVQ